MPTPANTVPLPNYAAMPSDSLNIYKASAGSGKTYTLTREYLRLVLRPGVTPRNILAITFTNAATADMKRKIVETLADLANGNYPDWQSLLADSGSGNPKKALAEEEKELRLRAHHVLKSLLHTWQDFSVKTIDSFVQNLIKPFAFELGLPQNYTPNIEENRLSEEITQKIIDDFGLPGMEDQTEFLRRFLEHRNESGKSLNLTQSLQQVVNLLFSEGSFEALERMKDFDARRFKDIINHIKAQCEALENTVMELLRQGQRIMEANRFEASDFHGGSKGLYAWFSQFAAEEKPSADLLQSLQHSNASVQKCVEKGILKKEHAAAGEFLRIYEEIGALDIASYFLLHEIQNSIYALALVNRAEEILDEIKETTAVIPISEFNKRIDKALSWENNNFIFERSGARYRHVFIDEFQDTSKLQWKNLRPLLEENLSQGNECLIVGDPKQSIYRFRNADMEQFVDLCQGQGNMPVTLHTLQSNWRSEPGIIAFNNAFYQGIMQKAEPLMLTVFEAHEQFFKHHTDQLPEADPQAVRLYIAKDMAGDALYDWYLKETLQIVRQFEPGDVTVLCRKKEQCTDVANYLVANGIAVSTPDSLVLAAHPGLNLCISSLRYIDSPQKFHKGMCFALAQQLGLWQDNTEKGGFIEAWESPQAKKRFEALAALNREQADVYDTVEAVLRFWNMDRMTDQYLLTFLDTVQNGRFRSLAELIDWWDGYADTTPVNPMQDRNCVNVMTIHKSKGLEFKVVVMPFVSDTHGNIQDLFWTSPGAIPEEIGLPAALIRHVKAVCSGQTGKDMEHESQLTDIDNLNVLYVATTRARQKLFMLCAQPGKKSSRFSSAQAICQFAEKHPEYVEKIEDGSVLLPQEELAADVPVQGMPTSVKTAPAAAPQAFSSWRERLQAARFTTEERTPEMEWGNFIHHVLSNIRTDDEQNLQRALLSGLNEYPLFKARRQQALEFIQNVLNHELLHPYFSAQYHIKSETGIAAGDGTIHIPDRVAIQGNTAVVLDYKTGAPHKSHAEQVRRYMKLLQETGLECTQGFLVYLGEEIKVEAVA